MVEELFYKGRRQKLMKESDTAAGTGEGRKAGGELLEVERLEL